MKRFNHSTVLAFVCTVSMGFSLVLEANAQEIDRAVFDEAVVAPVLINDADEARITLHPLRSFIEPSTFAVLDVSLVDVDLEATKLWIQGLGLSGASEAQWTAATQLAETTFISLREAGVHHVYAIVSTRVAEDGSPVIVIPCKEMAKVDGVLQQLLSSLPPQLGWSTQASEGAVLVGPKLAVSRVLQQKTIAENSTHRDSILRSLLDHSAFEHRVVFKLPTEAREDLGVFWPDQMPTSSPLQFSPRQLVLDLNELTLSWAFPPTLAIGVDVDAADASSSQRLQTVARDALGLVPEATGEILFTPSESGFRMEASDAVLMKLLRILQ